MGKKKKLIRFEENKHFDYLFEPVATDLLETPHELRGRWADFFENNNPIVLELGCGKGEYTTEQALLFPDKNFIGMDIKGSRINHGAKEILRKSISNACFVRSQIELVDLIFDNEISEVWITFPDPSIDKARRRLTSPMFLNRYRSILKSNAAVYLKTDSKELFDYTIETLTENKYKILFETDDYYNSDISHQLPPIKTTYEKKFLAEGKKICLLKFEIK
jgi:tRNA (guanine-N7-)-methyltransferase